MGFFFDPRALHCLFILIDDFFHAAEGSASNLAKGNLNALPGRSLFPLDFESIFHVGLWELVAFV